MTQFSFDLAERPWIPVLPTDSAQPATLGLRETLLQAHRLRGLYGESPLVVASLYRLLLAALYAIWGDPTIESWGQMWQTGRFPEEEIAAYFARHSERFDLFHPERPFYQWPAKAYREKRTIDLFPDFASGGNATLFDHHTEARGADFTPAQAARALLLVQTFSVSGGSGMAPRESADAPWSRGAVFLVEGDTLFQTLMLNFIAAETADLPADSADRPFWEAENPFEPLRSFPLGMCDYLTWPTRAMHLLPQRTPSGEVVVRQVRMGPGLKLEKDEFLQPYYHYRERKKDGKMLFQRFAEDRALWRDSASFLALKHAGQYPPRTFVWLSYLLNEGLIERSWKFRYMVLGMANNQAKVDFYREEHFPLPADYLQTPDLVASLGEALQLAEEVHTDLKKSLSRLARLLLSPTAEDPNGRQPDKKDINNLLAHWAAGRIYWGMLETAFLDLLQQLPRQQEAALQQWRSRLQQAANQAFAHAERLSGENLRALRAIVPARRQLAGALRKRFPMEKGEPSL